MTTMEILMLVGGLSAFVISFFLPDKNAADAGEGISQEELQQLFDDEVELSRQKIDDMTKETLDYSVERTERSLEKIANEKIMAVGEYSDTVLDQINQSHNQVVFLSDMLRKSKDELTELLNRADQTSKDANVRANEAYDLADHAMKLAEDAADRAEEAGRTAVSAEEKMIDARRLMHKVSPPPASADGSQGTDCQEDIDVVDIPEDLEVPGEIFEDLVNEFSLDDASEELADGGPRRGAEERLAESLSAFRESLRENEGGDYVESLSSYEGSDAEAEAESGEASEAEAGAEAGEADPFQVSDLLKSVSEEERFFRVSDHLDRDSEEPDLTSDIKESTDDGFAAFDDLFRNGTKEEGTDTYADEQPEMSIPVEKTDEDFAGMTEEEKMEALLRAATEELAQDVSAVTGISEMHWEPSETEEEEAASEDITCESTGNSDEDAERAAKARALEALKDEAESEYRETKAKALEALKAEAELAAVQPAADEEMAPAEEAEFLQSLLKGTDFADLDEAEPENAEARNAEAPVEDAAAGKKAGNTKKNAESEEEYADQLTIETVMKEFDQMAADAEKEEAAKKTNSRKTTAKRSAKNSGNGSRKRSSKKSEPAGNGADGVSLQFAPGAETSKNNNDRILEMHRMGRSDMAIAKDLGMGIGEVKLVIALDEIS